MSSLFDDLRDGRVGSSRRATTDADSGANAWYPSYALSPYPTEDAFLADFPAARVERNPDGQIVTLAVQCLAGLTCIPWLPYLKELSCYGCPDLVKIPPLPWLRHLSCIECHALTEIVALRRLMWLECRYCAGLTRIHSMRALDELHCDGCTALTTLSDIPCLTTLYCEGCHNLTHLDNLYLLQTRAAGVHAYATTLPKWLTLWQEKGLLAVTKSPSGREGFLVWKHVSPDLVGNLGYPYAIWTEFANEGMACAGPFGAVRNFDLYEEDSHLLAICAYYIAPVNTEQGVFYAFEGVPLAFYRVTNPTREGADLTLLRGLETPEVARLWE